ncbi:MAG: hypothetical protein RL654_976 [Pseudomonadota bacterium]|jgi:signal transduction histidine kinase
MMLSRIGAGHRREPSLQSPAMSLPPSEPAAWPLAARLGGIVATSTLLLLCVHWLAGPRPPALPVVVLLTLLALVLVALVAQLQALLMRLTRLTGRAVLHRSAEPEPIAVAVPLSPQPGTDAFQPPALRLSVAQLLELQRQLLQGLPGPAVLLRPSRGGSSPWQLLSANEMARATLPPQDSVALDRMLAELVTRSASPGARARRIDLPDGSLVLWMPPAAEAEPPTPPTWPETDAAQAAEDDRAAIVYTVSHDLRAPIRVIEGFTRIMREDYGHLLDRVGNDHLERIMGAATRMNGMIDALLALSRLSTQPLQSVEVDLSAMARQIIEELRQQTPERQVEVHIADGLSATGDPALLRSVLDNLIGNAWKYSSRREAALIEFGRARDPERGHEAFFLRDNGAGFDMRFASRLFGAFQRLHGATEFAGTGIGLASVRRIVRRHGGDIRAEAAVNQGATFWFTLG